MDLLAEIRKLKDAGIQEKDIVEALEFKKNGRVQKVVGNYKTSRT